MPARVAVVLDEPGFAESAARLLQDAGYDAAPLPDPHLALKALEKAEKIELLVTCADHGPDRPNGMSLALMAQQRRPTIKVLLIGESSLSVFADGLGTFLPSPVDVDDVVTTAIRMLENEG